MADIFSSLWSAFLDQLPKGLIGLLIPALQLAWRAVRERGRSRRRAHLRTAIADLSKQREQLKDLDASPENTLVRQDIERELNDAVNELASLVVRPPISEAPPHKRTAIARAFLLYIPIGGVAWTLHIVFFVAAVALGLETVSVLAKTNDPDFVFKLVFVANASIGVALIGSLARARDRQLHSPSSDKGSPRRRRRWLPAVLCWVALSYMPLATVGPFLDEPGGTSTENIRRLWPFSLGICVYFSLLALASRGWQAALSGEQLPRAFEMSRWRSALLLFRPTRPVGWLAQMAFWTGVLYLLIFGRFLVWTWQTLDREAFIFVPVIVALCALLMFAARRWASLYAPARSYQRVVGQAVEPILDAKVS
jgi:hypothetical protein